VFEIHFARRAGAMNQKYGKEDKCSDDIAVEKKESGRGKIQGVLDDGGGKSPESGIKN